MPTTRICYYPLLIAILVPAAINIAALATAFISLMSRVGIFGHAEKRTQQIIDGYNTLLGKENKDVTKSQHSGKLHPTN